MPTHDRAARGRHPRSRTTGKRGLRPVLIVLLLTSATAAQAPRPIEAEANVDRRRAEVGLPPLAAYRKPLEKTDAK